MAEKNIVQSALEAGREQARKVIQNPHAGGRAFMVLTDQAGGEAITYLERPDRPERRTGVVQVKDDVSFLEYWKLYSTKGYSRVYGVQEPAAQFVAVLNEHDPGDATANAKPGWRDHRINFTLAFSKEWLAWRQHDGQYFSDNEEFGEWLQDSMPDVVQPSGGELLEISLSMRVNQAQSFGKAVTLSSGAIELQYSNKVDGTAVVGGAKVQIPDKFVLEIPVFDGIGQPKYRVDARLRYRTSAGIKVRYDLVRPDKVIEQAFKELRDKIATTTEQPVIFGTP